MGDTGVKSLFGEKLSVVAEAPSLPKKMAEPRDAMERAKGFVLYRSS